MKIISLQAENFKRLKAVEIIPDPQTNLIQVRGRNGQGKSSVLDAIWSAVGGASAQPSKPVRNGEDKATIRLDLGDIVITRRFNQNGQTTTSSLRLEAADGARYTSPQTMLDKLIGAVAFDPLEFTRQKPREQQESLRALVTISADLDALDAANATDYTTRTEVNRTVLALRTRLEGLPPNTTPTPLPDEPINVGALTHALAQASDHNTNIERRRAGRSRAVEDIASDRRQADEAEANLPEAMSQAIENANREISSVDVQIAALLRQIKDLTANRIALIERGAQRAKDLENKASERATIFRTRADALQAKLDAAEPLPDPIDATALANEIEQANQTNALLDRARRRTDIQNQLAEAITESECLTTEIQARTKQKTEALAAATYPIPGLSLGEGEVLYNDVPLDQASQAEKIRVGVAVAIAANPKLRVIVVRDGSLLDTESLNLLTTLVTEADYQCWIEVTDDDAKIGVIIEDGSIAQPVFPVVGETTTEEVLPL